MINPLQRMSVEYLVALTEGLSNPTTLEVALLTKIEELMSERDLLKEQIRRDAMRHIKFT